MIGLQSVERAPYIAIYTRCIPTVLVYVHDSPEKYAKSCSYNYTCSHRSLHTFQNYNTGMIGLQYVQRATAALSSLHILQAYTSKEYFKLLKKIEISPH